MGSQTSWCRLEPAAAAASTGDPLTPRHVYTAWYSTKETWDGTPTCRSTRAGEGCLEMVPVFIIIQVPQIAHSLLRCHGRLCQIPIPQGLRSAPQSALSVLRAASQCQVTCLLSTAVRT